jgi:pilus assembly protein CpaB
MNNSNVMKIAAGVMLVIAVGLGILVANSYRQSALEAEAAREQARAVELERSQAAPRTLVVVAAKPLAAHQPIVREAVSLVPVQIAPQAYYTNVDEVVGRVPLIDVDAGAPITARYFGAGNTLARIIPEGHKALSMEINDVIAVANFVKPGDLVDVLLYLRAGSGVEQSQARVLLQRAKVLAYEDRIIDPPEGLEKAPDSAQAQAENRRRVRTVTLAVPDADTTRVMLGMSLGDLRLALYGTTVADAAAAADGEPSSLTPEAKAAASSPPDQVISVEELARLRRPTVRAANAPPPRPPVEIIRGGDVTRVNP